MRLSIVAFTVTLNAVLLLLICAVSRVSDMMMTVNRVSNVMTVSGVSDMMTVSGVSDMVVTVWYAVWG